MGRQVRHTRKSKKGKRFRAGSKREFIIFQSVSGSPLQPETLQEMGRIRASDLPNAIIKAWEKIDKNEFEYTGGSLFIMRKSNLVKFAQN